MFQIDTNTDIQGYENYIRFKRTANMINHLSLEKNNLKKCIIVPFFFEVVTFQLVNPSGQI